MTRYCLIVMKYYFGCQSPSIGTWLLNYLTRTFALINILLQHNQFPKRNKNNNNNFCFSAIDMTIVIFKLKSFDQQQWWFEESLFKLSSIVWLTKQKLDDLICYYYFFCCWFCLFARFICLFVFFCRSVNTIDKCKVIYWHPIIMWHLFSLCNRNLEFFFFVFFCKQNVLQ